MPGTWFYKVGPIVAGPYSDEEFRSRITAGDISAGTLVRRDGDEHWVAASNIDGLLPGKPESDPIEALARVLSEPPAAILPPASVETSPKGAAVTSTEKPVTRYHSGILIFSAGILLGIYLGGWRYDYHQVHSSNSVLGSTTSLIRVDRLTGKTQKLFPAATGWYDIGETYSAPPPPAPQ